MPSGLIALLDDVATIAKLAAASIDDVGLAAGKAGTKAAGVVIDDTAVTPRYVVGLAPERELPIIGKIAWGSLKNKLLFLLPGALVLTAFAPVLITPLLMLGGSYLAFEATEKILEKLLHEHQHEEQLVDAMADPADLEKLQVTEENLLGHGVFGEFTYMNRREVRTHSFGVSTPRLFGRSDAGIAWGRSRPGHCFNQYVN